MTPYVPQDHALRVLDLTEATARGAGRLLTGAGADVIRVPASSQDPGSDADLLHWHSGQRLLRTGDLAVLDRLAADADVVIESGPALALRGVRIGDDGAAESRWPHLVHVVVTPFGLTGSKRDWLADDLVTASAGGMTWLGGQPEGQPKPPPREQAAQLAGAQAAIAALLGLVARDRTGTGQVIDISAQEAVAATLETAAISWIASGSFPRRNGGVYPHVAARIFRAADGYVAGGYSGSNRMWAGLLAWMQEAGAAEDLTDPKWDDAAFRWQGRPHVDEVVARFVARQTAAGLAAEARRRALPWAEVASAADLLGNSQLRARNYLVTIEYGPGECGPGEYGAGERGTGQVRDVGFPYESPAVPRPITLQAPEVCDSPARAGWRAGRRAPASPPWAARSRPGSGAQSGSGVQPASGALAGLRVLDLTWVLAGPYATMQLADHGADVIKVESRHRQDPTRFAPSMRLRAGATFDDSSYFMNFNRNKCSIAVNMRTEPGVELVRRLARKCDVVIENFAPGVLEKWGLDYETLRASHPGVIVVSMPGVGRTGPWRNAVTFADTLAAMSGLSDETRDPGGPPQGLIFGLGDMVAGNAAVQAILERLLSGRGGAVDLAQLEAMAATMGTKLIDEQLGTADAACADAAHPNRHPRVVPHGVYPVRGDDRWIAISVTEERAWPALALLVPGLAGMASYGLLERRGAEDTIDELLARWTRSGDGDALADQLQRRGIPAAVVATGQDLVDHDPHLAERGFYPTLHHPLAGEVRHEGIVIRPARTPGATRTPAPLLGQHTDIVFGGLLSLTPGDLAGLRAIGVLE
jgi:crotonobetainyl-CoA:carnitine CoA-transferase CaiB-like acyl-CoA transferase